MPALKCSECPFCWDADDAGEPAPDHSRTMIGYDLSLVDGEPRAAQIGDGVSVACPGTGEPGACAACGGEGSTERDQFDHRMGHYTTSEACEECSPTIDDSHRELDG